MHWKTTGKIITAFTFVTASAFAQQPSACSWPFETTGTGLTNVAYLDTNSTYWTMPINTTAWKSVIIKGEYPQSRFFSFVVYAADGSVANSGDGTLSDPPTSFISDINVSPNPGSANPFLSTPAADQPTQYTINASLTNPSNKTTNFLMFDTSAKLDWLIYRVYLPNKGLDRTADVPLPSITFVDRNNNQYQVTQCPSRSGLPLDLHLADFVVPTPDQTYSFQSNPLAWIPQETGHLFPNPANSYIAIPNLCYQAGKIVVVRGKRAIVPDTYNGGPVWEPSNAELRYWSMCSNRQALPYPVLACGADHDTQLDADGYYTYVMSESQPGSPRTPPSWPPANVNWLPWGAPDGVDVLILRNMVPDPGFENSVQAAKSQGCAVNNANSPIPPDQIAAGAQCAQNVMKEYYPKAVYCDKQVFINKGWQGCFAANE